MSAKRTGVGRFFRALGFGDFGYRLTRWWLVHWPFVLGVFAATYLAVMLLAVAIGFLWEPAMIAGGILMIAPMLLVLLAAVGGAFVLLGGRAVMAGRDAMKQRQTALDETQSAVKAAESLTGDDDHAKDA